MAGNDHLLTGQGRLHEPRQLALRIEHVTCTAIPANLTTFRRLDWWTGSVDPNGYRRNRSAIDLSAMPDPHHQDYQLAALPLVHHAIATNPQAPQTLEFAFESRPCSGSVAKEVDGGNDPHTIGLGESR
jgi:hypothetical protein